MSAHLDTIVKNHEGVSNLRVVFVDIEKYSRRRTKIQNEVISQFSLCLKEALTEVSQRYVEYTQKNNVNLREDSILLSTGDGAAVVFSFDGLNEIHLEYAKALLKRVHEFNRQNPCKAFLQDGYCNDHPNFNLRIGISEGNGLIYRDVNDRYNVAGDVINEAERVMNWVGRNQIAFTEEAYKGLINLSNDPDPDKYFRRYPHVGVKHDIFMDVYQYVDLQLDFLNCAPLAINELTEEQLVLLKKYSEVEKAGFRRIYPDRQEFFNDLFTGILKDVKRELKIMGICISIFRESDRPARGSDLTAEHTVEILTDMIARGCNIKVLFLKRYLNADECKYYGVGENGDFYFMRERDEDFDYDFRGGRRLKIIANRALGYFIDILLELAKRTQNDDDIDKRAMALNRLQIREYLTLPSLSLYIADDDVYLTPYLCKRHCSTVPAFQVSGKETDLYKSYSGHFDAAWKEDTTASAIDERFIQLLISEPKETLALYARKRNELAEQEKEIEHKNPEYSRNPERYRVQEKAISAVLKEKGL